MTAVVDYDAGNIRSLCNALERVGARYRVTSDEAFIRASDRVIIPGVGEASSAMERLRQRHLDEVIPALHCPVLGICIGMQLMCRWSEEGNTPCLGIFDADVQLLKADREASVKVPHMGWNSLTGVCGELFRGIGDGTYFYFVHSYAPQICPQTIAVCENGTSFSAALSRDNFFGTQFHPEKSGRAGEMLLRNFLAL